MKKTIWIDVGTHFGQEYTSIFGSTINFFWRVFRRFIGAIVLNRGKFISISELVELNKLRSAIKKRRQDFFVVFVEANPKIIANKKMYMEADAVFNIALTDHDVEEFCLTKLYLANNDALSQGSSIYESKGNVSVHNYVMTVGLSPAFFMQALKKELDMVIGDYNVMLRLNCEGVEDDIIYAAYDIFNENLKLISGSLKDVKSIKGEQALNDLMKFLKSKRIENVSFSSSIESWRDSHKVILKLIT